MRRKPLNEFVIAAAFILLVVPPAFADTTSTAMPALDDPGIMLPSAAQGTYGVDFAALMQAGAPSPGDTLPPALVMEPRPLWTLGEVIGINTVIWSFNRYLRQGGENPGFRIGFNSWEENFKNGFEWDDNTFKTNQFAHPYHGGMYYNAARANGYDFWTSAPWTFLGSFMWEYMFEVHHGSYNDWVNTSVGGVNLGEMLWRISDLILDDTSTGGERRWREVAGFVVNPVRGFNRILTGENHRVQQNPPDRRPGFLGAQLDVGLKIQGQDQLFDADTTRVFIDIGGIYGDPFAGDREKPFDSFDFSAQLTFGDAAVLGGVQSHGLLYVTDLSVKEKTHHMLRFNLGFDYFNNNAYTTGGQSITAGVVSRFLQTAVGDIQTDVNVGTLLIAGVKADYPNFTGRPYDYGPGFRAGIGARLLRKGHPWLQLNHTQAWINILNGTDGSHLLSATKLRVDVPITRGAGVGAQYLLYLAESRYDDFEDDSDRFPELKVFLSLPLQ